MEIFRTPSLSELRALSILVVLMLCQTGCVFLSLAKERPSQITVPFSRGTKPFGAHVAYTNFENADFDFLPLASLGEPNQNSNKKTLLFKDELLKRLPVTIQSKLAVVEFTLIFSEVQDWKRRFEVGPKLAESQSHGPEYFVSICGTSKF